MFECNEKRSATRKNRWVWELATLSFECNEKRSATAEKMEGRKDKRCAFECNEKRSATYLNRSFHATVPPCLNAMKSGVQQAISAITQSCGNPSLNAMKSGVQPVVKNYCCLFVARLNAMKSGVFLNEGN